MHISIDISFHPLAHLARLFTHLVFKISYYLVLIKISYYLVLILLNEILYLLNVVRQNFELLLVKFVVRKGFINVCGVSFRNF